MKKILICLQIVSLLLLTTSGFAQHIYTPAEERDITRALRAGRITIESDKLLLEPNEAAALGLKLTIYPTVNQETEELQGTPTTVDLPDGTDPNVPTPYREGKWKILQGGGTLTQIEPNNYSYTAPATAPPDKTMVISVELIPTSSHWPKMILLQTLYFIDDQTAIVVILPEVGFNSQKFVSQADGGVKVPTMQGMDPRVASHISPDLQAKMAQAQAAMAQAQQSSGINLSAITSNSMMYYDVPNDLTAIKFTKLSLQMENGRDIRSSAKAKAAGAYACEISYKGTGLGRHQMNDKASGTAFHSLLPPIKACGCGNNRNGEQDEAPCNGYVNIQSIENGVAKGEFAARVYNAVGKRIVRGFIHGKFTANIAK